MRSLAPACCAAACALLVSACAARPARVLYLVPIHAAPELIESLAAYYRDRLGVNVQLPGAVQVDSLAFDTSRRQLVAEEAIKLMRDRYAALAASGPVIGVTSWDMYIRDRPWQFGFSWRQPPYAAVSYARMDPARLGEGPSGDRLAGRLRKMVSRNVGVLLFGLGTNADRTSLMYQDIMGIDDLDRTDEDLARAGFPIVKPAGS